MAIEFPCACGKKLSVAEAHAGKLVKCPVCGEPVMVPELSTEDAAFHALMEAPEPPPPAATATRANRPAPDGERPPAPPPPPYRGAAPNERTLAGFDPEPPRARRETRPRRREHPEFDEQPRPRFAMSSGMIGGIIGMLIGGGLLIVGLLAGRIIIWSVVIFVVGFISTVKGLLGHSED